MASTGSDPVTDAGDIVAAYSEAAVPELDILWDVEKDLRGDGDFFGRQNKRRRKSFMREERRWTNGSGGKVGCHTMTAWSRTTESKSDGL